MSREAEMSDEIPESLLEEFDAIVLGHPLSPIDAVLAAYPCIAAFVAERCAEMVPSSWLDPLLTGTTQPLIYTYDCTDIENLLREVKKRIRAAFTKGKV
jgi:hypothetical protein